MLKTVYAQMKRITTFLLSFLSILCLHAQTKHTISGYITDKSSKETLIGATILDLRSGRGAITNEYGFYSLTLTQGPVEIRTGYVGYKPVTIGNSRISEIEYRSEENEMIVGAEEEVGQP